MCPTSFQDLSEHFLTLSYKSWAGNKNAESAKTRKTTPPIKVTEKETKQTVDKTIKMKKKYNCHIHSGGQIIDNYSLKKKT